VIDDRHRLYLEPDFGVLVHKWKLQCAAEGIRVVVFQAYRSDAYQADLCACWKEPVCRQARGIAHKPALPGASFHNVARAVDPVIIPRDRLPRAVELAKGYGLRWGGDFWKVVKGKKVPDPDTFHFDDGIRYTLADAKLRFHEQDLVDVTDWATV